MPGIASLEAGEYYAHPRNAFWPIMGRLFGAGPELAYAERAATLKAKGVAVWDVLQLCVREGSLDSNIRDEVPNDFTMFFAAYPSIRRILLNGGKAGAAFRKYGAVHMPAGAASIGVPSTSPAHASLRPEDKVRAWQHALES